MAYKRLLTGLFMLLTYFSLCLALSYGETSLIETNGSYRYYHIYDKDDMNVPSLQALGMTFSTANEVTRGELGRIEAVRDDIRWSSDPEITAHYVKEDRIHDSKMGVYYNYSSRARLVLRYLNDRQSRPGADIANEKWEAAKITLMSNYDNTAKKADRVEGADMVVQDIQSNRISYILRQDSDNNYGYTAYTARHVELFGQFLIDIDISGSYKSDVDMSEVMAETVKHVKGVAEQAQKRADEYYAMFDQTGQTKKDSSEKYKTVSGSVVFSKTDGQKPSPNQRLLMGIFNKSGSLVTTMQTQTDESGRFVFKPEKPLQEGYKLKFSAVLSKHMPNGNMLFSVIDFRSGIGKPIVIDCGGGEVAVSADKDLANLKLSLYDGKILGKKGPDYDSLNYVNCYDLMKDATDFYTKKLNHPLEDQLAVKVVLNAPDRTDVHGALAYYSASDGEINVLPPSSNTLSKSFPNTLFHELAHHVMYGMYEGNFPYSQGELSHNGYANISTANSFMEGFADFMAYIVEHEGKLTERGGTIEVNHKAWQNCGFSEEYAVAGVLLDLCDSGSNDDEDVNIGLATVWAFLNQNEFCANFNSFYARLKAFYANDSSQMASIDKIFLDHGFFAVTEKRQDGTGTWEFGEAFSDANFNYRYDPGERVVDYNAKGQDGVAYQEYRPTYELGRAACADHMQRNCAPSLGWHTVKTKSSHGEFTVEVSIKGESDWSYVFYAQNINGELYIPVPPPEYDARIKIFATGNNVTTKAPLSFTSADFYGEAQQSMQNGYFLEHDFKVVKVKADNSNTMKTDKVEIETVSENGFPVGLGVALASLTVLIVAALIIIVKRKREQPLE